MKFGLGNAKLGANVVTLSRPVGDTCPSSCTFLGNGCYAERIEKMYPNVRASSQGNLVLERNRLRSQLVYAHATAAPVRLMVTGDFMRGGKLDREFIADLRWACESITSKGGELPAIWCYSHCHVAEVAALADLGIAVYASVSSMRELRKARKAGFKLFAWADRSGEFVRAYPRGGASYARRVSEWQAEAPAMVVISGERFVLCPNQRKQGVTCAGSPDSKACRLCVHGRANVLFAEHS
jgi:hypothetical protein